MRNKMTRRNIKIKIVQIAIMVCLIILVISSYLLTIDFLEYKESNDSSIELIEEVVIEESSEEKLEIDWQKLEDINQDIVGWIKIEDSNINYPILKDTDNLKYIKHSFDGRYNKNGAIFTLNDNPFKDNLTVLYGHNMKSGLMFSDLSKYVESDFFKEHSNFEIYTKNENYKVTVFSCYSINIREEENNIKLLDFEEEIEYYKKKSKYLVDNVGEIKKIVKLSTCSYLNSRTTPTLERYYIVAKLEKMD